MRPASSSELLKIVRAAERNNLALALTGTLLFDKSRFVQVLEGERSSVTKLFIRISQDSRHEDIASSTLLLSGASLTGRWR
ncbi:BLUF domain-containing protein [Bradyrhizobium ottawaense]|uniref:BLUF domain-containing protein n=1 Tax=Bradyrhizobium ottawaense TaxID=931866 RepID=UPI0036F259DC